MSNIECTYYKELNKSSLVGYCSIFHQVWKIEIFNLAIFSKNGRSWVSFPSQSKAQEDGTKKYYPDFRFKSKEEMDKFSESVLDAVEKFKNKDKQEEKQEELMF
ncbi:MAG TPA: hypothetical protein VMX17_10515 [Candidatus Glassbacteria bacterium]|nr:hypothetical protein [Candidatus Glassbacteria bacterium]